MREISPSTNDPPTRQRDQRRSGRLRHNVSLAWCSEIPSRGEKILPRYHFGDLVDISEAGICFRLLGDVPPEGVISLFLKLSTETSGIRMLAKVVWTRAEGADFLVGAKFIGALPVEWRQIVQNQTQTHGGDKASQF